MTMTRKIAVLRGRHDSSAVQYSPALEQACQEMLVKSVNPQRDAVLEYWSDNTDGTLQFEVTFLPWVEVGFTTADVSATNANIDRMTSYNKVKAATLVLPAKPDLSGYDGFICLVAPGDSIPNPQAGQAGQPATFPFDGGSNRDSQTSRPVCVYPIANSSHTFMCHEFGHLLGWFDDDGIAWRPGDTGYGDPFSIMSAEAFAGARPTFAGTPVANWPNAAAKNRMGPAPSRAVIHYRNPAAQRASFVKQLAVPNDAVAPVRLFAAYADNGAPRLLFVDPDVPNTYTIGRMYLEYRDVRKWDRGLDIDGNALDRRSVVVHVAAMRPAPDLGAGDAIGNRCYYRGRIVVPAEIDSDLKIAGTPFTVRVVDADVDAGWVDVKITRSDPVGFEIEVSGHDDIAGHEGPIEEKRTPCGDYLHYATWLTIARYALRPVVWGLGGATTPTGTLAAPPTVRWRVGGVDIAAGWLGGRLSGCQSPQGTFDINFSIDDAGTLHLDSTAAGQAYQMPIAATASDAASGISVSTQATFPAHGRFHGLRPKERTALLRCMQRTVAVFPPDLRSLNPPRDQPRPNWLDEKALEDLLSLAKLDRRDFR